MTVDQAIELSRNAVLLTLLMAAPVMIVAVVVGLAVSILQAVTQLQDQTLSFVPKIIAMLATLLYLLPWLLGRMTGYAGELFQDIPLRL